jgi:hypothetical protein
MIVVAAVVAASCDSNRRGKTWVADSTAYVASLDRWLRDSAVVDSVSRLVDLTELVAAYREMATGAEPAIGMKQVSCAQLRVSWDYGGLAAASALERANDSIKHLFGEKAFAEAVDRMGNYPSVGSDDFKRCRGKQPERRKSVGNTPLDTREPRPLPPRGWPR